MELTYLSLLAVVSPLSTLFITINNMLDPIFRHMVDPEEEVGGMSESWLEGESKGVKIEVGTFRC